MRAMTSQITGVSIVCSTVCSGTDQRKHQSSASLAFVRRIHRWPVNSPHKGPVTRKMCPFDDVIMTYLIQMVNHYGMQQEYNVFLAANQRVFVDFTSDPLETPGYPDGCCIDTNDNLWVASWNSSRVFHFNTTTGRSENWSRYAPSQ